MSYNNTSIINKTREFVLKEIHTSDVLKPVNPSTLVGLITNPFTGNMYDGIVLSGVFAEMDIVNNNSRFYTEDNYLPFVEDFKKKILEKNGVLGTLEHPATYATDAANASHKVIDIWYNKEERRVYGTILVLNTPKGRIIREIYESGSYLSISARSGGKEIDQPNGTKKSVVQLMVTFDVVSHPGFSIAELNNIIDKNAIGDEFTNLNESNNFNDIFSYITYVDNAENVPTQKLFESQNHLFEAARVSKQEKIEDKNDEAILEKNEVASKNSIQNNLQSAVQQQLKQSSEELKKRISGGAYYDNAAGFVDSGLDGVKTQGQVGLINQSKKLFESVIRTKQFTYDLNYFKECIRDYNISLDEISEIYEISETIVNSIEKKSMSYEEARQYVLDFTIDEKIRLESSRFNLLEKLVTNNLSGTKYKLISLLNKNGKQSI